MLVLGIDPGAATTGYGIVANARSGVLAHHGHGVIKTPAGEEPHRRLAMIYEELSALIRETKPDVVALEELFFKNNITTGIAVAQARGVMLLAVAHADLPVASYKPAQVKQAVVGVGRATKQQVQFMTKTLLGLADVPKPDDAADGLAVAICHVHRGPAESRLLSALSAQ